MGIARGSAALLALTVLAAAAACVEEGHGGDEVRKNGEEAMSEAQSKAIELVDLRDGEYFTFDEEAELALQMKLAELFDEEPEAALPPVLAIGAPGAVDPDETREIPVLVATCQTGLRRWKVDLDQNFQIVATDLRTGAVSVAFPFMPGKREMTPEPSMSGEPPDEFEAASLLCGVERLDLRRDFDIEWPRSRFALTAIAYDRRSNSVEIDLGGEERELAPREPSAFLDTGAATSASPEPGAAGIALSLPDRAPGEGPIPVRGEVRVPKGDAPIAPAATSGGEPLLLASLLLLRLDERPSPRIDLAVPAEVGAGSADEGTILARFGFDLRAAPAGRLLSGLYQVYLVVGRRIAGPYPITIGSPGD